MKAGQRKVIAMNIKNIHLFFICASMFLALFFAFWSWGYAAQQGTGAYKTVSFISVAFALALGVYAVFFIKKMRVL